MTHAADDRRRGERRLRTASVADRVKYRGYDILPDAETAAWVAWISHRDVPHGRVSGQPSVAAAVTAAKREIDRWEAPAAASSRP